MRAGDIPQDKVNDLGIIYSVWLDPGRARSAREKRSTTRRCSQVHREATAKVIRKAMRHEPSIDWLLENQDKVAHYFHQQGLEGNI